MQRTRQPEIETYVYPWHLHFPTSALTVKNGALSL